MSTKRVLLVDDDPDLRMLVEAYLKGAGYEVSSAVDGLSCLIKAQQARPDLVILDLGLPAGDGMTALQRLRTNTHFAQTPVLVLSARSAAEWRDKAIQQGASAYLQKPVDKQTLLESASKLLGCEPAPALPVRGQLGCPHCGGSLESLKVALDEATIAAIARAVRSEETPR